MLALTEIDLAQIVLDIIYIEKTVNNYDEIFAVQQALAYFTLSDH